MVFGALFSFLIFFMAVSADSQWAYVTPPWTFNEHDKYAGREFTSIPINEWKQEAAFDSAALCEKARLFAYKIRNLPQGHRERLLGLFGGGAERQAIEESERLIPYYLELESGYAKNPKLADIVRDTNWKILKQWEASKCVPLSPLKQK